MHRTSNANYTGSIPVSPTMFKDDDEWWHVTCKSFTCCAVSREGIIIESAPIIRKFIGQRIDNLDRWVNSIGGSVEIMARSSKG